MDDLATLEQAVAGWVGAHAADLGLEGGGRITARYIWNPGGFVNRSFTVSDGSRKLHVKLADPGRAFKLRRWAMVHDRLEQRYHAPRLIHVAEGGILPGDGVGLVFEHVNGRPLDPAVAESVLPEVLEALARLHGDTELAGRLGVASTAPLTCADAFAALYLRRFRADLAEVVSGRRLLDFVPDRLLARMEQEIGHLAGLAAADPAFQTPAQAVVHRDLHWGNILVDRQGRWTLIDWDGLTAGGDPALDYSILLWPLRRGSRAPVWPSRSPAAPDVLARLALYDRAKLFDEIIDPLADYVAAGDYPEYASQARARARAIHESALALYQARYR